MNDLADSLIEQGGNKVDASIFEGKTIGLYFSAKWVCAN